jgi:hypothetical protein
MTIVRRGLGILLLAVSGSGCSPAPSIAPAPILPPVDVPVERQEPPPSAPIAAGDAGAAPAVPPSAPSVMETALKEWSRKTQCQEFDYYPNGGIQSFWCHRPGRVTLANIRELAGVDIFAKGPHSADAVKLDDASEFGHYNAAFVRWVIEKAGPSERGSAAQKATQPSYDAHLKPLAEIFWKTYAKAQADEPCFTREKAAYGDLIAKKKLPKDYYERWFFFMNPYFCDKGTKAQNFFYDNGFDAGVDGNVTKSVIGFWLRRAMDGTKDSFVEGLKKLLAAYEPELMTAPARFADPAALTRTLDAGVKAVAACKDAKAKAATAAVAITISGDGHLSARLMAARAQATPTQATCIEQKFSSQQMTPFDGESLVFNRTIALK